MFIEIIIYIALFAALFSGAFAATFQSIDALHYLESKKDDLNARFFVLSRFDSWLEGSHDWQVVSGDKLNFSKNIDSQDHNYVLYLAGGKMVVQCSDCSSDFSQLLSGEHPEIKNFVPQIVDTSTSSVRILNLKLYSDDIVYTFPYYEQK